MTTVDFPPETKPCAKFPIRSQRHLPVGVGSIPAIHKRRGDDVIQLGKPESTGKIRLEDVVFLLCSVWSVFLHGRSTKES